MFSFSLMLLAPALAPRLAAQPDGPHPDGRHDNGRRARREIEDLEEQWRTATLNGDVASMDRLLADDFVGITWTGQVNNKEMQLDRIRNHLSVVRRMELGEIKIKVVGPIAIVTSRAEVEATSDGEDVTGAFRYTRVYQRVPSGGWKITNFEATRIPPSDHTRKPQSPPML